MGSRTGGRNSGDQEPVSRITEDLLDALPEVAPLAEEDVEVGLRSSEVVPCRAGKGRACRDSELAPVSPGHLGITMEA